MERTPNPSAQVPRSARGAVPLVLLSLLLLVSMLLIPRTATAATRPDLGTAASFGVLAATTVTNTGSTVVNGNLGVSPGKTVTGFPPGSVTPPGTIYAGGPVAVQAQSDAHVAYNDLAGQACNLNLTGRDLGGLTLTPAAYCFSSAAQLTGQVILNGQENPNAVFVFQIGGTLSSASGASVSLTNGASPCNVFWQIGNSATLGTATSFVGNVLTLTSITLASNTTAQGGLYALNGAVTLNTNTITLPACSTPPKTPTSTRTSRPTNTSTPTGRPTSTSTPTQQATSTPTHTPKSGILKVCKTLAPGTPPPPPGSVFTFRVIGASPSVANFNVAPATCHPVAVSAPSGSVVVQELPFASYQVSGIVFDAGTGSVDVANGRATANIVSGKDTEITFINSLTTP